jgi:hypothetical protein
MSDVSGNLSTDPRPIPTIAPLKEGIKTINDIFKSMENATFESFVEAGCKVTGAETEEVPKPATREDFLEETNNNMTLKQQFASLRKFKDVPMTYSEMRERYG